MLIATRVVRVGIAIAMFACASGCDYFRSVPERLDRAQQLFDGGNYRAAAIELKNVLDKEPANGKARLLMAEIQLATWRPQAAHQDLEAARAAGADPLSANDVEIRLLLATDRFSEAQAKLSDSSYQVVDSRRSLYEARAILGQRRYAEALDRYADIVKLDPNSHDARLGQIEAAAALGRDEEARERLAKLLEQDSADARAWKLQARFQLQAGRDREAVEALETAHRWRERRLDVKDQIEVLAILAELQLGRRNIAAAERALADLDKIAPGALFSRLLHARVAIAKYDYVAAAAELQRIARAAPDVAPARFLLGMVLLQQGHINQAEQHLSRAVALAPQNLEARKLLAQAQLRLDRPQAAIESLAPAFDMPGLDLQLHGLMGLAERQAGVESGSIEFLKRSLAEQPDNSDRKLDLAIAYVRAAQHENAIATLRSIEDPRLSAPRSALMGFALARARGASAAYAEFEAELTRRPRDIALIGAAADFYAQMGQLQRGIQLLTEKIERMPNEVALRAARARLFAARGDAIGAETDLRSALDISKDDRGVLLALAELSARRGDVTEATAWLDKLGQLEPENVDVPLLKARLLLGTGRPEDATRASELLNDLTAKHGERGDILSAVARSYMAAGRYDEALNRLRAASAATQQDDAIRLDIARTQLALGQNDAARSTVSEILSRKTDWLPAVALGAWLDIERGAREEAIARMAELRKQRPNDPQVLATEGEILMTVGRADMAAGAFEAALKRQPTRELATKTYLARSAARLPDPSAPLRTYVDDHPFDPAARLALAQAYQTAGDAPRAIVQYEKLVADGVGSPAALNNLAWLYSERKDPRALTTARRALELAPQNPAIQDTVGWILVQQGKHEEALPLLRNAVARAPDVAEIRYHYAVALARNDHRDDASQELKRILRDPAPFAERAAAEGLLAELERNPTGGLAR